MSVSSKKGRKRRRAEEQKGGVFPVIEVNDHYEGLWWTYRVAPFQLRLEIPLEDSDSCSWLWIDGEFHELHDRMELLEFEMKFGVATRMRLMQAFIDEIRNKQTRREGIARLEGTASAAGLYGNRESLLCPRCCS